MFEITAEDVKAALDRAEDKAQRFYGGDADMLAVLYAEELEHLSTGRLPVRIQAVQPGRPRHRPAQRGQKLQRGNRTLNLRKNAEMYDDPTAYAAIKTETQDEKRVKALVYVLKYIIGLAGFELSARIVLRDKKTGREYR